MLLGAGGHAASTYDVLTAAGWTIVLVAGDSGGVPWPVPVITTDGRAMNLAETHGYFAVPAVGDNRLRERLFTNLPDATSPPAILAPTSTVAISTTVGSATVVHHHAHVGPRTDVGSAVIINTAAVVEHDCSIGAAAHIAPGAVILGGSYVGPRTLVGAGAKVLPGIRLGADVTVGAGAVITRDVPDELTVAGVPATVQTR